MNFNEIIWPLSAGQLELLADKGASDRQFRLIFRCTVCAVCICV